MIDLGLLLHFGASGIALMPEVEKITHEQRLELPGEALKRIPSPSDFEKLLGF